jgi:hypothetical protein
VAIALSLCTTAQLLYTRFTNLLGASIFETTMRPNPIQAAIAAAEEASAARAAAQREETQVRKTPSWPRSWANFSLL